MTCRGLDRQLFARKYAYFALAFMVVGTRIIVTSAMKPRRPQGVQQLIFHKG